jgi:lipopolysaccharide export LptBFGC system permease protein LptF
LHSNKQFEKFLGKLQNLDLLNQGGEKISETSEVLTIFFIKTEVIFVKDMLYAVLALVTALIAAFFFYRYIRSEEYTLYIVIAIISVVMTIVFGGLFLSGRVNKTEDIHITE